jgi:tripartite ATP-independent transporter DctP family solute receptor
VDNRSISFLIVGVLAGALAASIGFSFGLARSQAVGSRITLRLAHALPESHPVHAGIMHMKERISVLSGGSIELQVFPNGLLGNETALLEQVQKGVVDITKISTAPMEAFVPAMEVFGLPYIFRNREHFWKTLDGDIGQELLHAGMDRGLRGLCYLDAGSRNFYTISKPVRTPDDLAGMKIRVQRSEVAMEMIRQLGGAPTPIPWNELYTALQQGMVDGAENNPPSFVQNNHDEVAKFFVFDEHTRVPDILVMNAERFAGLSPQIQAWIDQAAREASIFQRDLWEKKSDEAVETAKSHGVQFFRPDITLFADKLAPMLESIDDAEIKTTLKRIHEVE